MEFAYNQKKISHQFAESWVLRAARMNKYMKNTKGDRCFSLSHGGGREGLCAYKFFIVVGSTVNQ